MGRAQLKEIASSLFSGLEAWLIVAQNEGAAREEIRALKSCIRDRKAQVDDPVKQIDNEMERFDGTGSLVLSLEKGWIGDVGWNAVHMVTN